jgi:hypothetical protein
MDTLEAMFDLHGMVAVKNHTAGLKTTLWAQAPATAAAAGNLNGHTWDKEQK